MKNVCIIFLLSVIISLTALGLRGNFGNEGTTSAFTEQSLVQNEEYLRIHVRADSNENGAQAVKYKVRDRVVEYLTPLVASYKTKAQAMEGIAKNLEKIAAVATQVLHEEGFAYSAKTSLRREEFPTRVYGEYVLPAGEYTALILELGRGEGDNWWCVVYPPLCFAAVDTDVVYRSKILEIIEDWKADHDGVE